MMHWIVNFLLSYTCSSDMMLLDDDSIDNTFNLGQLCGRALLQVACPLYTLLVCFLFCIIVYPHYYPITTTLDCLTILLKFNADHYQEIGHSFPSGYRLWGHPEQIDFTQRAWQLPLIFFSHPTQL